jgi:hypothetical protein
LTGFFKEELKWNVVVVFVASTDVRRALTQILRSAAAVGLLVTAARLTRGAAGTSSASEQYHVCGHDFGSVPFVAFFVLPFTGLNPPLDANAATLGENLVERLSALSPYHHGMPLGTLLALLVAVYIGLGRRHAQVKHRLAALRVPQLRILPYITDQYRLVQSFSHK